MMLRAKFGLVDSNALAQTVACLSVVRLYTQDQ